MENNNIKEKMTELQFQEYMKKNLRGNFIGAHGTQIEDENLLEKMVQDGLNLKTKGNAYGMAGTVMSYGITDDDRNIQDVSHYSYSQKGIIISVPVLLEHENRKTFLGYPERTQNGLPKDQKDFKCLMTEIFDDIKYIPSSFILGHYNRDENGKWEMTLNEKHFHLLDSQSQAYEFWDVITKVRDNNVRETIRDFTTPYNIEKFDNLKQIYEMFNDDISTTDRTLYLFDERDIEKQNDDLEGNMKKNYIDEGKKNKPEIMNSSINLSESQEITEQDILYMVSGVSKNFDKQEDKSIEESNLGEEK